MFLSSPCTFPVRGFPARSPLIFVQLCLLSVLEIPLYAFFFLPRFLISALKFPFFSSVKVVHAFHALDDFLIFWFVRPVLLSQFCLAGLRHCLMDLGASTGVSAFLMVCGIIPHTLYTQSFAFLALVSQFLDQNTVSPPFSHFGRGRGLEKKRLLGSHRPLLFFLRSTVSRIGFLDDHKKREGGIWRMRSYVDHMY